MTIDIPVDILKVYGVDVSASQLVPFYSDSGVHAGFPSPARDYEQEKIDLNKLLIKNPAATFLVDCCGDSMIDAFIAETCLLVVDRSEIPAHNDLVLVTIDGGFIVRRLETAGGKKQLTPQNRKKNYPVIDLSRPTDYTFWGVVTRILIDPRKC